jgi:Leucine-rich repeat (LRR) protein
MAAVITSITGLQNLPNLQNFNADYNSLTTVNLSGLANLLFVDISDNDVLGSGDPSLTSVNLSGCTALQTLRLDDSDFSAGIPNLAGLTSLTNLDMDQCSISGVVDLTGLSALEELDFYGNTALTSIIIDDAQPIQYFYASSCALTETAVDNILIELSDNGIAGGNVELDGGTNAIPSATGLAAKSALEADGWTVDINEPTTTTTTTVAPTTTTTTTAP